MTGPSTAHDHGPLRSGQRAEMFALLVIAALVAWLLLSLLIVPALLERAYRGEGFDLLARVMAGRGSTPFESYLADWRGLSALVSAALVGLLLVATPAVRGGGERIWSRIRPYAAPLLLLALLLRGASFVADLPRDWREIESSSHELIAGAMVAGHGFSAGPSYRGGHIGTPSFLMEGDVYPPTAWKEPVYPFLVAGALQVFGERARPAMMLFNIACLLGTAAALFFLGRAVFDAAAGAIAAALLLLPSIADVSTWHRVVEQSAAGLMTTLCALALLACLDRPSWRRGLGLGALFGVSALTHSATLLFVPLAAGLMLIRTLPPGREQWKTAACVAVAAAAVIAPWTLRNYAVFGEFVAVRTGFGFNAYLGNPIFSETVAPGPWACSDTLGPLWTAAGTDEALRGLGSLENRRALYYRARDCVERDAPASYAEMNEAQREALYLNGTRSFVLAEPALAVSMGFHKARHFFYVKVRAAQKLLRWIAVVGALSALVRPRGRVLLLLGLAFCVPYVVALPFFDRYSYSIEPLVCLLAARTLVLGARALWRSFDPPLAAS